MPVHLLRMNCNHLRKITRQPICPPDITLRMLIEHDSRTLRLKKIKKGCNVVGFCRKILKNYLGKDFLIYWCQIEVR